MTYSSWVYNDSYGYSHTYFGWGWKSPDGVLYDDHGNALNNLSSEEVGKDLIDNTAAIEEATIQGAGKAFALKYALSEASGVQVARTLNDWATLSKKFNRARTDADMADFTQRLYGVSVDKAKSALAAAKAGDSSQLENLNREVAKHWGTTPETSKAVLKNWYKDELSELSLF